MSMQFQAQVKPTSSSTSGFTPVQTCFLQRRCDGDECAERCKKKRLGLQTKLMVNQPGDIYEQEADRIADQVLAAKAHHSVSGALPQIQRFSGQSNGQMDAALGSVDRVLASTGRPLDPALQQDMGQRLGHDFSRVRVHSDAAAEQSARDVSAHAYTVGHNIVFGAGRFAPGTHEGQRLIAHELTHVVQQSDSEGISVGHVGLPSHSIRLLPHVVQQRSRVISTSPTLQRQAAAPVPVAATGGLSEEMLRQIARTLREAMAGWGTDEEAIYSAFSGRTQEQVNAISRVYQEIYHADLLNDLRDELTDSEMEHLAIFSPTAAAGEVGSAQQATSFADMIAHQLNELMVGLGTDEDSIYAALTGRTQAELQAIKDAYKRLTNRELEADIRDEMSGSELTHALALLNQGVLFPEDEIYLAMKGAGTDEETLLRVLETVKSDRAEIIDLIDKFAAKGYGNLLERVNEELSGSDLNEAMEALHGETPSGTCLAQERQIGLEAISGAVSLAQNGVSELDTVIGAGALSNKVKTALDNNFNPGGAAGAVTVGLAGQVRPVLHNTRSDLLTVSDITCGAPAPCVANPTCRDYTYGWTYAVAGETVRLCPAFFTCLGDEQPRGMLHEFVHHIGIHDKAYRHEAGFSSLTPRGDKSGTDSLDNADSFAHFAKEVS